MTNPAQDHIPPLEKPSLAGRIFYLSWLPFWFYSLLFFRKNIKWRPKYGGLEVMHFSPIDSSFTWIRLYLEIGNWWAYPIVIQSGYQPNVGLKVALLHKIVFNNTKWATRQLWLREGKHCWIKDEESA